MHIGTCLSQCYSLKQYENSCNSCFGQSTINNSTKTHSSWNVICPKPYRWPKFNTLSYGKLGEVKLEAHPMAMSYLWPLAHIFLISYNWKHRAHFTSSYSTVYPFGAGSPALCSQEQMLVIHYITFACILHQQVAIRTACLWFLTPQLLHSVECLFFSIVCCNYRPLYAIVYGVLYDKYYASVWRKLLASPTY